MGQPMPVSSSEQTGLTLMASEAMLLTLEPEHCRVFKFPEDQPLEALRLAYLWMNYQIGRLARLRDWEN